MTTVATMLDHSARLLGITSLSAAESADMMGVLNMLLANWAADGTVYARTHEYFTLTDGTSAYTYTAAGSCTRLVKILKATLRDDSNLDTNVRVVGPSDYENWPLKSTEGRPRELYFQRGHTNSYIYLYPTPDYAYTLRIQAHKALGYYTATDDTLNLPPEYEYAVRYNLAVDFAPEIGLEPTQVVAARAKTSLDTIERYIAVDNSERVVTAPFAGGRSFDINSGLYT